MELMLDLMIHCQVTMPISTTYLRKIGGASALSWHLNQSSFDVPSRKEAIALPEPLLTELSRVWIAPYGGCNDPYTQVIQSISPALRIQQFRPVVRYAHCPLGRPEGPCPSRGHHLCPFWDLEVLCIYLAPDPRGSATMLLTRLLIRLYSLRGLLQSASISKIRTFGSLEVPNFWYPPPVTYISWWF